MLIVMSIEEKEVSPYPSHCTALDLRNVLLTFSLFLVAFIFETPPPCPRHATPSSLRYSSSTCCELVFVNFILFHILTDVTFILDVSKQSSSSSSSLQPSLCPQL